MADLLLQLSEDFFFEPYVWVAGSTAFPRSHPVREFISLAAIVALGAMLLYFSVATAAYYLLFDRTILDDKRALPNQIRKEIRHTLESVPTGTLVTTAVFALEVRGHSLLFDDLSDRTPLWHVGSLVWFFAFTDCFVYFAHRGLHDIKFLYKYVHKPHHAWKVTSPFASHAFHPFDGFAQSLPYHIFVFLFPLNKYVYLAAYVGVNFWTVSIHDGYCCVPAFLRGIINGAAHHTDHHSYFNYNHGQYTTLWDRIGGTYREPDAEKELRLASKAA